MNQDVKIMFIDYFLSALCLIAAIFMVFKGMEKINLKDLEWVGFWIGLFGFFVAGITFKEAIIISQSIKNEEPKEIVEESPITKLHSDCWEIEVDGDTVLLIPRR